MLPTRGWLLGHVLLTPALQPGAQGGRGGAPSQSAPHPALQAAPSARLSVPRSRASLCQQPFQPLAEGWAQGCLTQHCLRCLNESRCAETVRCEVQLLDPKNPHPSSLPPTSPGARLHLLLPPSPVCWCQVSCWAGSPTGSWLAGPHGGVQGPLPRGHSQVPGFRAPSPSTQWLAGGGRPGCLVAQMETRW